jgi:hypothetical protein
MTMSLTMTVAMTMGLVVAQPDLEFAVGRGRVVHQLPDDGQGAGPGGGDLRVGGADCGLQIHAESWLLEGAPETMASGREPNLGRPSPPRGVLLDCHIDTHTPRARWMVCV